MRRVKVKRTNWKKIVACVIIAGVGATITVMWLQKEDERTPPAFKSVSDYLVREHLVAQLSEPGQRSVTTDSDGRTTTQELEIQGDGGNVRTIIKENTRSGELIVIGDKDFYSKDYHDGHWWYQQLKAGEKPSVSTAKEILARQKEIKPDTTYKNLGQEHCGNLTCHKYEKRDKNGNVNYLWFDTEKLFLRKMEIFVGASKSTVEYSYGKMSISAPSPTKPLPPSQTIFDRAYGEDSHSHHHGEEDKED